MNWTRVADYAEMSEYGAERIFRALAASSAPFNLGLATGNTMLELYRLLAEKLNRARADLSRLRTWNLDEYVDDDGLPVGEDHPLSYRRYMRENFFSRLDPALGFREAHFPGPEAPEAFDAALAAAGGLDFQLLGIGFNGHIAFNEPMSERTIDAGSFSRLPTRLIDLEPLTIETNRRLTAGGADIVPRRAATMGMKPILEAKEQLLLACFAEQKKPLEAIRSGKITPELPASCLLAAPRAEIVWTADTISLS
ncbi:6-phosphogluconolactonase [Victivallis vadensis]|uniref:6-phosphogluconolactonase n=1 Tax=Victivallis vadensis TaxID=172901 RepID=UPI00307DB919